MKHRQLNLVMLFLFAWTLFTYAPDAAHPSAMGLLWSRAMLALLLTGAAWGALA